MATNRKNIIVFVLVFAIQFVKAQDIHFTQFWAAPVYVNPAMCGASQNEYRLSLLHRNQWSSVSVPYITFMAAFETNKQLAASKILLGYGLKIDSDKAGDAGFGSKQLHVPLSLSLPLRNDSSWFFSVGASFGMIQSGLDFSKLTFDNQYNGLYFDPSIPPPLLNYEQIFYSDISTGINLSYQSERIKFLMGTAIHHVNKPGASILKNTLIKRKPRLANYIISTININTTYSIQPAFMWQLQGQAQEKVFGSNLILNTKQRFVEELYAGIWGRWCDAMLLTIGGATADFEAGINYDFNLSNLKVASKSRGGVELFIVYKINKIPTIDVPYHSCPVFF